MYVPLLTSYTLMDLLSIQLLSHEVLTTTATAMPPCPEPLTAQTATHVIPIRLIQVETQDRKEGQSDAQNCFRKHKRTLDVIYLSI